MTTSVIRSLRPTSIPIATIRVYHGIAASTKDWPSSASSGRAMPARCIAIERPGGDLEGVVVRVLELADSLRA